MLSLLHRERDGWEAVGINITSVVTKTAGKLFTRGVTAFLLEFPGTLFLSGKLMDYKYEGFSLLECVGLSLHSSESNTRGNGEPVHSG